MIIGSTIARGSSLAATALALATASLALATAGCGPSVYVMRHGAVQPPRAGADSQACKMRFASDLDPQTVTLRYQLIGQVVITGGEPGSAKVRELVRARACQLGGRFVVPGAALGSAGGNTETYLVLGKPRDQALTIGEAMRAGAAGPLIIARSTRQRKVVVAVFDIEDRTERLTSDERDQLSEYLATRIAQQPGLRVAPRDRLRARLGGQRKQSYRACYTASCQIEIGKVLAAQKSLSTHLLKLGDGCAIAASLYDLQTETSERAATVPCSCKPGKGLLAAVDTLVARLAH